MQILCNVQYLGLYTFQYLINYKNLLINKLNLKYYNFTTTERQILQVKSIRIIAISVMDRLLLKPRDVVYIPNYNSNFISFGQFCDNNIVYINNLEIMI